MMTTASAIQENADDILAEAKEINARRAEESFCTDEAAEDAESAAKEDRA